MELNKIYNNFIELTENIAKENINNVLNEFLFFGAFTKEIPSINFIYRKITGKPFDKNPLKKSLFKITKYWSHNLFEDKTTDEVGGGVWGRKAPHLY